MSKSILVWCIAIGLFAASTAISRAEYYQWNTDIRGTYMWVPSGLSTVRGIVIWGNGAGADERSAATAPWLQQFAEMHGFALIGTSMWGNLSGSEINTWDQHIAALASASGHPELKNAPYAPLGFSNGGQMSYGFNALRPEKTIAFISNKGCCYNNTLPPITSLNTPGILIAGELDTDVRRTNIRALFDNNRPRGALWSWVEQPGVGHSGLAQELTVPFMDEAIRARYPANLAPTATSGVTLLGVSAASGWLADQTTWKSGLTKVAAYDAYPGNKQTAGWLLNENVAAMYRSFSTYDRSVRLSFVDSLFPPLPEINYGFETGHVKLRLDLSAVPGWTKFDVLDGAASLLQVTSTPGQANVLTLDVPITQAGVYGFSALVTQADGQTQKTSNLLLYTAVPEPSTLVLITAATLILLLSEPGRPRPRAGR